MGAIGKKNARDVKRQTGRIKKDPGIPNLDHFKKKQANKEEERRKKAAAAKERQSQARQQLQNKNRKFGQSASLLDMVQNAQQRGQAFDDQHESQLADEGKMLKDAALTGEKDNSKKAYFREFKKVLEHADVVLEILDARDPLGTRTRHVERMIMESGTNKKIILVLNKIDLVPKENVEQWLKYLRNEYPAIAFKSSTQSQRRNLGRVNVSADEAAEHLLSGSECLGADALMALLKNYCRSAQIKTSINVGIIGYPNVGKSSVINSLARAKVCGVGSTPGFTKVAQQITLDKNIKLLDCPGIVFATQGQDGKSDAEIVLRNCIKVELLEDPVTPVEVIVSKIPTEQLMMMYDVGYFNNAHEFLVLLAQQRGKLKKGGVSDIHLVARAVLQDWNGGKIPFYTLPPANKPSHDLGSAIVSSWGQEINIDQLQAADQSVLSGLRGSADFGGNAVVMQTTDLDMMDAHDDTAATTTTPSETGSMMMDDSGEAVNSSGLTVQLERMRMKKKGAGSGQPQRVFTAMEEELMNSLQRNQMLAKERKQMQKKLRKQTQGGDGESNEGDYGFAMAKEEDEPMAMMTNDVQLLPDDEDEDL
ncbi:P-loop containing nucleoside triphosphate hydrolase protein [Zychaea mexicana]|uniref:P-loop containing nucleoside triphosphate hydrolase protein n=1 Tax=Zychaea mexicana TaxID=64656 RepID=UPI0022FE600F|nr:P-loop containing nucleoside triphosphate hydrolase protein [Zychaea mexicana]KAI9489739.1 P-loop containing nucleoside triphosphate hydrolase protein [Zychaea mexicana]